MTYLPTDVPQGGTSYERRHDGRVAALIEQRGEDVLVDLEDAAARIGERLPSRMLELIAEGPGALALAREVVRDSQLGTLADGVRLLAPLPDPPSMRDFFAFEDHVRRGFDKRGEPIPEAWYELPVYYLTNHRSVLGPGETIPWPSFTSELDYELEIAMIVGREGSGLGVEEAERHIFGYTLYNDCSARDLQRKEMQVRLGPARSKGFAQVLGPVIVTADEVDPTDLRVTATIDGETVTDSHTGDLRWSFAEMLSYVSRGETVYPGDVYGSGTVANGCGLEHGRMLQPGETLELSTPVIGTLVNTVGEPAAG
ncbi:MAG: fumarylacetoacetate hydrolase family protein [Nitriliruptorales bacterium]|nr:fumarylacetoacetate hydrolase family protein [Nitriliruptorales bacterium]